jgi:transcriptional regulator with XRE-family HTH domain
VVKNPTLRQARKARGLTLEDVAYICGVRVSVVSDFERGARIPRPRVMDALEELLGPVDWRRTFEETAPKVFPKIEKLVNEDAEHSAERIAAIKLALRLIERTPKNLTMNDTCKHWKFRKNYSPAGLVDGLSAENWWNARCWRHCISEVTSPYEGFFVEDRPGTNPLWGSNTRAGRRSQQ